MRHNPDALADISPVDLANALEAMPAAVALVGPDNVVAWSNAAWRRGFGDAGRPDKLRVAEQEGVHRRVRETRRALSYRDILTDTPHDVVVTALDHGRLLVTATPAGGPTQGGAENDGAVDRIDLAGASTGPLDRLSKREREVLALLAGGLTIKRIAERLGRSEKTVEGHRDLIYRKLGVSTRAELAIFAVRSGLHIQEGLRDEAPLGNDTPR